MGSPIDEERIHAKITFPRYPSTRLTYLAVERGMQMTDIWDARKDVVVLATERSHLEDLFASLARLRRERGIPTAASEPVGAPWRESRAGCCSGY